MGNSYQSMRVTVTRIEDVTPQIKRFTMALPEGGPMPGFTGGGHVIVQMEDGGQRYSNAYSLMNSPEDRSCYQIGVRREERSKGGSAFMHDKVRAGDTLTITTPNNMFALREQAQHHVLIAGGIGITPFMSQLHDLRRRGARYELHYAFRSPEHGAFRDELAGAPDSGRIRFYADSLGQKLDLGGLLGGLQDGAHVYVCGPQPLIDAVRNTAATLGVPKDRVHWEQFAATVQNGGAFSVVLAKSGKTVEVASGETILKAIEREHAASVDCLCREGVCGTCETRILDGEAQHFDQYLSDDEKAAQKTMMICVSRARGQRIVLDL
ncbi:PDR/VanB family oxidoreductase [Cupriavidus basilensis]|uniref:Carnitine monooxygenase reductase subunit n=1 Tax=Cupriavidus basilensis TaxID=68895 RepID=A0ABT6AS74_9BURK|nr:PDR/VanB family oxidoreductase [Cupriavidus basilensis]MDF3835471.1 PDR/VanB family oxidoreductase [Cupriavidus basilensis]